MATPDPRLLRLAVFFLAGLHIGIPWAEGGRSPVGQASLIVFLVMAGAIALVSRVPGSFLRPSPVLLLAGTLAGGSALHTIYPDRTVQSLLLLLSYLLAGAIAACGAREIRWAESVLLTAIFISGGLVTTLSLFDLFRGDEGGLYANLLTGPFAYPNAMAGFLLVSGGVALAMVRDDRGPFFQVLAITTASLAIVGLFLTRSRGALLAAVAGTMLWVVIQSRFWWSRRWRWVWLGGFGVLVTLIWIYRSNVLGFFRISSLSMPVEDSSLEWRLNILRWTWSMALDHPWWGVGPGAFPVALTHYQRLPYVSGVNPHNLYLELAAEYGLPAGILVLSALGGFLVRLTIRITRAPTDDPVRRRLAILLATLVAFLVHSLVDLDWSFPAIALIAATMLGLASAHLPSQRSIRFPLSPIWRACLLLLLAAAALLALSRYYSTTLVAWARLDLEHGRTETALHDLTWALRLNPLSFPGQQWLAWTRLRSGDIPEALEVADRATRTAPLDPNSQHLAGQIAAVSGRWNLAEDRFRAAVDRAPSAQLRFHAGLVDSAFRAGRESEARFWHERAAAIFTPERVLSSDARCVAPGDRYLLAQMNRIAAKLYAEAGESSRQNQVEDRARLLAQPDSRGICVTRGRPGQTSPETAMESFWRALADGGWSQAERLLAPDFRVSRLEHESWKEPGQRPYQARVAWIAALSGGERQASLRFQLDIQDVRGYRVARCAQGDLRLIGDNWFVERVPVVEAGPCQP